MIDLNELKETLNKMEMHSGFKGIDIPTARQLIAILEAAESKLNEIESELSLLIPDSRYMDPPDGGNAPIIEQIKRMINDTNPAQSNADKVEIPQGQNEYGLDANYFYRKLELILRDIRQYKPDEMARALARLAKTSDENVLKEPEFTAQ